MNTHTIVMDIHQNMQHIRRDCPDILVSDTRGLRLD